MIRNQRQYKITKAQTANFARELAEFDESPAAHPRVQPRLIKLMKVALEVQLAELQEEIKEYERLQHRKTPQIKLDAISEIPDALVRARITSGLSQRQLAEKLGMKEQQIQRYESTNYQTASLRRVLEVAAALSTK
jgi:ribosome-binding protein aMBF1 (putative translation factor)